MASSPPRYIAVEGVIGVGKTSLTKILARHFDGRCVHEPVIENPFLARFYEDRKRFAFQTQLFFLLTRYQQQQELKQPGLFQPVTVCDYLFAKDRLFATLNLDRDELALYNQVYDALDARLPAPDLVVYLQADVEVLIERIRQRGLDFEQGIDPDYLRGLSQLYNDYFFDYREAPLLVVQTSGIDFVNNGQDQEWLIREIVAMKGGTKHLIPLGAY
jgi:deoxyadenosine/deoxycytidine kinase